MLDAKLYSTGELDAISDALSQSGYICDLKEMFEELFFFAKRRNHETKTKIETEMVWNRSLGSR